MISSTLLGELWGWVWNSLVSPALVLGAIAYIFREKLKQLLAKSMAKELEKYKHELALERERYSAGLTPQLELVKHDFQQKLEAYKVSLIADAEAARLKVDVRRQVTNKFFEIKFQRFIEFERAFSRYADTVPPMTTYKDGLRSPEQFTGAFELYNKVRGAYAEMDMFLELEDQKLFVNGFSAMQDLLPHIGVGKVSLTYDHPIVEKALVISISLKKRIREHVHEMARI